MAKLLANLGGNIRNAIADGSLIGVRPMTEEELRDCITLPARNVGLRFEDGLVDAIINDAVRQPGSLPLLETVLTDLWYQPNGQTLLLAEYRRIGGIAGALSRQADLIFGKLSPRLQRLVPLVLSRLLWLGEREGEIHTLRATRHELGDEQWDVAQTLAARDAGLLVSTLDTPSGSPAVEFAHNDLSRWHVLRVWISENRDFLRWRSAFSHQVHGMGTERRRLRLRVARNCAFYS